MSNITKLEEMERLFYVNRSLFMTGIIPDYFKSTTNNGYVFKRVAEFIRIYDTYFHFKSFYKALLENENKLSAIKMILNSGIVTGLKEAKDLYEDLFEHKIIQEKITSLDCYKLQDVFNFVEKQLRINGSELANNFTLTDFENIIGKYNLLKDFQYKLSKEHLSLSSSKNDLYNIIRKCLLNFVEFHNISEVFYILNVK